MINKLICLCKGHDWKYHGHAESKYVSYGLYFCQRCGIPKTGTVIKGATE